MTIVNRTPEEWQALLDVEESRYEADMFRMHGIADDLTELCNTLRAKLSGAVNQLREVCRVLKASDIEAADCAADRVMADLDAAYRDCREMRTALDLAVPNGSQFVNDAARLIASHDATEGALEIAMRREDAILKLLDPDEKHVSEVMEIRSRLASSSPLREELHAAKEDIKRLQEELRQALNWEDVNF